MNETQYNKSYTNDHFTVKGEIDYEGYYGKVKLDILTIALNDLNSNGRRVLAGILNLLNDDSKDLKTIVGEQGYRGIISCSHKELASALGITKSTLSKGIANLKQYDILKQNNNLIIVNPLVYNQNTIFDIRALKAFDIQLKHHRDNSPVRAKNNNLKVVNEGF